MYTLFVIFFFKQKTAYEMRISDWSSDVCSSDLPAAVAPSRLPLADVFAARAAVLDLHVAPQLERYLVELVLASRDAARYDADLGRRIAWGARDRKSVV